MSAHFKYQELNRMRLLSKSLRHSHTYTTPKPPIRFRPSKDTKSSSLLTYIRQQKTSRRNRVKITLPTIKEP